MAGPAEFLTPAHAAIRAELPMTVRGKRSAAKLLSMYGLAVGTDLTPLMGCTLESLDLTLHQLQLRLDSLKGISLSIESDFSIGQAGGAASTYLSPPEAAQALANLLGVDVVDAQVTAPGTLELRWANGSVLQVFDSNEHYESYQIYLGERLIVV